MTLQPILFHLGPLAIRSYGLMIAVGVLAGTYLAYRLASRAKRYENDVLDFILYAVIAGVVGARLWEVAFTWDYYGANPAKIAALWEGGLSIQGAILGGFLACLWFVRSRGISFWPFADTLAPGLILGQALGRIGCFLNGDAYGVPTSSWIGVVYKPETMASMAWGNTPLVPAELFEAAWDLAVLSVLLLYRPKRPVDGRTFLLYAILYSVGRFVLEFWRSDSLRTAFDLKTAQVTSLIVIAVALVFWVVHNQQAKKAGRLDAQP